MKKMKVVDKFAGIKAMLNGEKVEGFTLAEALAFLDERISITEKKNASGSNADRKPTKEQIANEGIKQEILNFLATQTEPVPMGEIMKAVGIESNQKVTALVSSMLTIRKGEVNPNGKVVRSEVKGKAHFALAEQE